jgi:hypothetical protein
MPSSAPSGAASLSPTLASSNVPSLALSSSPSVMPTDLPTTSLPVISMFHFGILGVCVRSASFDESFITGITNALSLSALAVSDIAIIGDSIGKCAEDGVVRRRFLRGVRSLGAGDTLSVIVAIEAKVEDSVLLNALLERTSIIEANLPVGAEVNSIEANEPSPVPSNSPSFAPSSMQGRPFEITTIFEGFDDKISKNWCLTAETKSFGSNLHMRPCISYDSLSENLQLFSMDEYGQMKLAGPEDGYCLSFYSMFLTLASCESSVSPDKQFSVNNSAGYISQTKNGETYRIGFDGDKKFQNVRLYRIGSMNRSLDKWRIVYE